MKIIISPAKKMQVDTDTMEVRGMPPFPEKTGELLKYLRGLSYEEAKQLWNCNDALARLNYARVQEMDLNRRLTPALLSYEGIQYQYMAPGVMEGKQWEYLQEHLCILSGFYGAVRPLDGVVPYRLEMQAKVTLPGVKNLYEFWGRDLYDAVVKDEDLILNLASKEYSKCVEKYVESPVQMVSCVFGEEVDGKRGKKVVEKGTYAKMARGEMVRFLAEIEAKSMEDVKKFDRLGYTFSKKHSNQKTVTFLKQS